MNRRLNPTEHGEWLSALRQAARDYRAALAKLNNAEHEVNKATWAAREIRKEAIAAQRQFIAVFALLSRSIGEHF